MSEESMMDTSTTEDDTSRSQFLADMSDIAWKTVDPDEECIPRIRASSESSSESDNSSSDSSDQSPEHSSGKFKCCVNKEGAMLSIMWCLKAFEEQSTFEQSVSAEAQQEVAHQNPEPEIDYENPVAGPSGVGSQDVPSEGAEQQVVKKRRRRKRRGYHYPRIGRRGSGHRGRHRKEFDYSSDDFGSIDSSPETYRGQEWIGFRFKSKVLDPPGS